MLNANNSSVNGDQIHTKMETTFIYIQHEKHWAWKNNSPIKRKSVNWVCVLHTLSQTPKERLTDFNKSVTICWKHCNAFARYLRCYCCPLWFKNPFKGYWNLSTWNNTSFDWGSSHTWHPRPGTCSPLPKSKEHERRTRRHTLLHILLIRHFE